MRKCLIHVGMHRTGTTALQEALSSREAILREKGYLYPRAGRPLLPGHHNIAWEIVGDRRFEERHGTIEHLIQELDASPHHVILSSEDFEGAVRMPRFADLIRVLQARNFSVVFISYLRNPLEYLLSLYFMLVFHFGLRDSFDEFLQAALRDRSFLVDEMLFQFDYAAWINQLDQNAGVDIIVRSHEQARASIVADFLSILDLKPSDLNWDDGARSNATNPPKSNFSMFLKNRVGRDLSPAEIKIIDALFNSLMKPEKLDISQEARYEIERLLGDPYRNVLARFKIRGLESTTEPSEPPQHRFFCGISVNQLFSPEAGKFVLNLARSLDG